MGQEVSDAAPGSPEAEAKGRAIAYLEKNGTWLPLEALRGKLGAAMAGMEALLATASEEEARLRPAVGRWCVQEIVDHLIESHRPAIPQLAAALAGADPGAAIPAHLLSAEPLAASYARKLAELAEVHRGLGAIFDGAPENPGATRKIPIAMVLKLADGRLLEWEDQLDFKAYLQGLRVHTLEHQAQVERTLAAIRSR
jgi:hypothetical protein